VFKLDGNEIMRFGDYGVSFSSTPPTVGYYCIGHWRFAFQKKPNLWHRFFMRLLLNLRWEDEV